MDKNRKFHYIVQVLYELEKQYGFPITLYETISYTVDTITGNKTPVKNTYPIRKAIVLAGDLDVRYKALLGVQKDFAYGGQVAQEDRYFVINKKYLPPNKFVSDDWYVTYNNQRYDVIKVTRFEHDRAIVLFGKFVPNSSTNKVEQPIVKDNLILTPSVVKD